LERRRQFEDVIAAVYVPLQRYLRRRTDMSSAEDVLGDVLLVLWRRVPDIPTEGTLPWCYAVGRRCLANHERSVQRRNRLVSRLATLAPPPLADDSGDSSLTEALDSLSANDRELLRLWAWEQLSPREIADVLGISPNAASIRLHRATGRLRQQLSARGLPTLGELPGRHGTEASR